MSLVWHIVRKDFLRLRGLLLLWAVLLTGYLLLAQIQFKLDAGAAELFRGTIWVCGAIFLPVLSCGLVLSLQADDAVCDEDAFWVTRPISAGQLAAAKCCTLVLYLFLPVIFTLPWWMVQGYGINEVAPAVVQTIRQQALLTLLAAPVALISANSRRFVMQGFVLAACLGLPFAIYGLMTQVGHADVRFPVAGTELLGRMAWLIWLAATVVVALTQYRFRQSGKSIFLLAAAALGIGAVLSWGRLSLPPPASATVAKPASSPWRLTPDNGDIQIRGEEEQYCATVNGETRPLEVLVAGPVEVDRRVGGNGRVIRIEYFSLAGLLTIPLSESEPAFRDHPSKGQFEATDGSAYLVVNHRDGRVLRAQVTRAGNSLEVATMRFFRTTLTFPLTELDRAGIPPDELASWMQTATLLKVANPVAVTTAATAASR